MTPETLRAIAMAAGHRILEAGPSSVRQKTDGSPVTGADRAADEHIRLALHRLDPSIPIISEETEVAPYSVRKTWTRFWMVDGLDGTKEFLAGRDEFTVNIALIEDGVPTLGVVHAPLKNLTYFASRGSGSFKQEGDRTAVRIHSRPQLPGRPLRILESRSHPSPELELYLLSIPVAQRIQHGSSLKFCVLAEGGADLYPRFGPTMEWDVAAGDCIYRYSGESGPRPSPFQYNKESLRNGNFILGAE